MPFPALAEEPLFSWPLDCILGETCFIQQYVDRDAGPGARDYTCGPLSYDGHRGTDIRLAHRREIENEGVTVLAAAPGQVLAIRDNMRDIAQGSDNSPDIDGREFGNGVLIDHGDGWRSQYCHMRKGSITVKKGQKVSRGRALGLIGLSGQTEFPHLHIKLTNGGDIIDPFQPNDEPTCETTVASQLWEQPIAYSAGGLMAAGFAAGTLSFDEIRQGPPALAALNPATPALVLWAYFYGLQKGDKISLVIRYPNGSTLIDESFTVTRNRAELYRLAGKKRRAKGWPEGKYFAYVKLTRNGVETARQEISIEAITSP